MSISGERMLRIVCERMEEPGLRAGTPSGPPPKGCVHLHFATISQLRPRAEEFNNLLDPVELDRAERFRFPQDQERFILGHGFLRSILANYLQRDGSLIRLARGPFGKPYLERKDLHFNFSDTKDAILVAFVTGHDIGADIETMAREVDHAAVSEHYFTPPEVTLINGAGDRAKQTFLEFWTRKEAVLKASGVGIMDDLRSLRVDAQENHVTITHDAMRSMAAPAYFVHSFTMGADHLISVASPEVMQELVVWGV